MKLTAREEIAAPIEQVFDTLNDFGAIEREAIGRGVSVTRQGGDAAVCLGTQWNTKFEFNSKSRSADITVTEHSPPNAMRFLTAMGGLQARSTIELIALSEKRTKVDVTTNLKATTLKARLLLQSLKLAQGSVQDKYSKRISVYARGLEARLGKAM